MYQPINQGLIFNRISLALYEVKGEPFEVETVSYSNPSDDLAFEAGIGLHRNVVNLQDFNDVVHVSCYE